MRLPIWTFMLGLAVPLATAAGDSRRGHPETWRANAQRVCEGLASWAPTQGDPAPLRCDVSLNAAGMTYELSLTGRGEAFSTELFTLAARELARLDQMAGGQLATMAYQVKVELDDRIVSMQLARVAECASRANSDRERSDCVATQVLTHSDGEVRR